MGSGGGGGESRTTPSPPLLSAPPPVVVPSPRERENHNPHVGAPGGDRDRRRHPSRSSARCVPR